jgi:hypothetical protein
LELIAIPPPSPSWPKWVLKKNIISLSLFLSLRDQGSTNIELYFSESEMGGGGGMPKIKTQNFKNYSIVRKSFHYLSD